MLYPPRCSPSDIIAGVNLWHVFFHSANRLIFSGTSNPTSLSPPLLLLSPFPSPLSPALILLLLCSLLLSVVSAAVSTPPSQVFPLSKNWTSWLSRTTNPSEL